MFFTRVVFNCSPSDTSTVPATRWATSTRRTGRSNRKRRHSSDCWESISSNVCSRSVHGDTRSSRARHFRPLDNHSSCHWLGHGESQCQSRDTWMGSVGDPGSGAFDRHGHHWGGEIKLNKEREDKRKVFATFHNNSPNEKWSSCNWWWFSGSSGISEGEIREVELKI